MLLAFLTTAPAAAVSEYHGPVVTVLDGNTNEVLHNIRPKRIRLSGIDCPEKGQTYGKPTKLAASDLAYGTEVTLQRLALTGTGAPSPICACLMA